MLLMTTRVSAIKFVQDQIAAIQLISPAQQALDYFDWDSHADNKAVPDKDLIGLSGFALTDTTNSAEAYFSVTVATYEDPNLFRMIRYLDVIFEAMRNGRQFKLYHPETGAVVGSANFLSGSSCSPVHRAYVRSTQTLFGTVILSLT